MTTKKYCPVHCFNYTGPKCPFCEQERIDRMVNKHQNRNVIVAKPEVFEETEITQESLNNLLEKFNCR